MSGRLERVDKAYRFLRKALEEETHISTDDVVRATGWAKATADTYLTKKWECFVVREGAKFRVSSEFRRFTLEQFRSHQSQVTAVPVTASKRLVDKAVAACLAAIETYNMPNFPFGPENFAILAGSGWELLLKARIVADADESLVAITSRDKKGTILVSKSGNPRTISMLTAAEVLHEDGRLPTAAFSNLRALACFRDESIHLPINDLELDRQFQGIAVAYPSDREPLAPDEVARFDGRPLQVAGFQRSGSSSSI